MTSHHSVKVFFQFFLCLFFLSKPSLSLSDDNLLPRVTVDKAFINMRLGPGSTYPIFHVAERGETMTVHFQRTDWFYIENRKGIKGWAHIADMQSTLTKDGLPLILNAATLEDFKNRQFEIGFMLGDFGGNDTVSLYGGYHFTENLTTELSYNETFGTIADGTGITLSLIHHPFPQWRYSPFVGLGTGIYKTKPKTNFVASETRTDNSASVTAGVSVYLSRRMLLRLQYTNYLVLTNLDNDEEVSEWKIGISTFY